MNDEQITNGKRPGDAVRRTDPARPGSPLGRPLIGEVTRARPGSPPSYLVDFITSREWILEPYLTPSPHFMMVPTGSGIISSAHVARLCLSRIVTQIETGHRHGRQPDEVTTRDFRTLLAALSNWSGITRRELLKSFSQILTEENGSLIAKGGRHAG